MLMFITVAHIVIAIFLAIVVLIQPGKGGGLVMGGGSQTLFGATGAGNFFTKLTTVLVILLVGTSIALTKIQNKSNRTSLFDSSKSSKTEAVPPSTAPQNLPAEAPAATAPSTQETTK